MFVYFHVGEDVITLFIQSGYFFCYIYVLQGFIEMEDKQTAATFLSYYAHATPTIR